MLNKKWNGIEASHLKILYLNEQKVKSLKNQRSFKDKRKLLGLKGIMKNKRWTTKYNKWKMKIKDQRSKMKDQMAKIKC